MVHYQKGHLENLEVRSAVPLRKVIGWILGTRIGQLVIPKQGLM